ncbi:hypothetical protein OVA24_14790 [Luteolibacter sp. SL250]|uniref:HD domain-containing protein n=1 Tax=Luteolibacter sp. SL250 TaxID=2995170 RepID=UPI00226D82D9|nr:hypothetical protein [Luteolibacter sp. SL250]WAC18500.1 hypothetical protein OVA24_14790 [Luteolibacter sp. SL250]
MDLCSRVGIPDGDKSWSFLLAAYSEPVRTYHNLSHIGDCLRLLDKHRKLAVDADAIEMALWFHDLIYDPQANDNEEASARCARDFLGGSPLRDEVVRLILATQHPDPSHPTADESLIRDIDLSILGSDTGTYGRYASAIRQEYHHVPDDAYAAGRAAILSKFLELPRLFMNPAFSEPLDLPARRNMAEEILKLTGNTVRDTARTDRPRDFH